MTEAQALRRIANTMKAFMQACVECGPYTKGPIFTALKVLVTRQFLPIAEMVELAARREEEKESAQ